MTTSDASTEPAADLPGIPDPAASADPWSEGEDLRSSPAPGEALVVDVEGFEGPLDLLLALARTQKVDLARISILALVDQYLAFIADARRLRLELAADYLVTAAWLAFLKSRLLLPREAIPAEELSGEEMALRLSFRLMRLAAMREAAARLMTRNRLGRDVFGRGMPEGVKTVRETQHTATVYDLLKAYAEQRQRRVVKRVHTVQRRTVWSIKDARMRLERLIGSRPSGTWLQLDLFLSQYLPEPELGRTALASSFGATLEMAREGTLELRQSEPFAPIYMRHLGAKERVG
jgi:segregation and condensation protein A